MEATDTIDERRRGRILLAVLGALLLLHFLNGSWYLPMQEPDEGRYGDISAAMARTGDWLTPRLNDIRYYEKPPMFFWMSGLSMAALGPTEFAARLPSVLSCFLTALLIAFWGWKTSGRNAGLLAGAILATLPVYALMAHMVMVDLLLTLFTTAALYAGWKGLVEPEPDRKPELRWILAFWGAAALACLTKGPIGLALPLVAVLTALAFSRQWRRIVALIHPAGPALFLLVALPWYLAMENRNPGYLREFFVAQNYERLATGGPFGRNRPFWYYVPVFLGYFIPWTFFLPAAIRSVRWKSKERLDAPARLEFFLACSVAAPLALLSMAHSMLGYYILPIAPPFALWVARAVAPRWAAAPSEAGAKAPKARVAALAAAGVLVLLVGIAVAAMGGSDLSSFALKFTRKTQDPARIEYVRAMTTSLQAAWPLLAAACGVIGAFFLAGARFARSGRGLAALSILVAAMAVLVAAATAVGASASPIRWTRDIALRARAEARPGETVLLYSDYSTSVPFYLRRPAIITTATYSMFGHEVGEAEAEGRALQDRRDRLIDLFERNESLLIIAQDEEAYQELLPLARGTLEVIDRQGTLKLVRHRRSESAGDGVPGAPRESR